MTLRVATYSYPEGTVHIDKILDENGETDYYDLFDESGSCLNEGDAWYPGELSATQDLPPSYDDVKAYLGYS